LRLSLADIWNITESFGLKIIFKNLKYKIIIEKINKNPKSKEKLNKKNLNKKYFY
jgi:hypothetical protein